MQDARLFAAVFAEFHAHQVYFACGKLPPKKVRQV